MPKKNSLLSIISIFVVVSSFLFAFSHLFKLPLKADDSESPEIVAWVIEPDTINSDGGAVDITFYARIKASSGVSLNSFHLEFMPEDETIEGKSFYLYLHLMNNDPDDSCNNVPGNVRDGLPDCGNQEDGIFSGTTTFPSYSYPGKWLLSGTIADTLGNTLIINDLEGENRPSFTNVGENFDNTPPVIKSLVVDKTSFDTSEEDAIITITMELEDDLSGINTEMYESIFHFHPVLEWGSPLHSNGLEPVEGEGGFFTTEIIIPKGSKPGFWTFAYGQISDMADNKAYINFSKYIDEQYFANTAISSEVIMEERWWLEGVYLTSVSYEGTTKINSSWPSVVIIFEEGTTVTKQGGGNFGIHRMVSESYITEKYKTFTELLTDVNGKLKSDIEKCHESEGCVAEEVNGTNLVGNPINIGKVGLPGLGLSFSKPATVILAVDEKYLGQTLEIQTFDGAKWVDIGSCLVKTFDPIDPFEGGGPGDEFYKSVSYPGCSFTTDHASFFSANVLGAETEETEKLPGVPNTGLGGTSSILYKYIGWIR